jgi:hypothetical protein
MDRLIEVIRKLSLVVVWVISGGMVFGCVVSIADSIYSGYWDNGVVALVFLPLSYGFYVYGSRLVNWIFSQ